MEKILVYLGSDHVIQHPSFGVRENILKMTTDREVAISQACEQDAAGVINTYSLDLDSLSVKAPEQQVLNGFDGYDVVIPQEEAACYISICSEAALNSLVFTNASFVCQYYAPCRIGTSDIQIVNFSLSYCKSLYIWI